MPVPVTGMALGSAQLSVLDHACCVALSHAALIPHISGQEAFQLVPRDSRVVTMCNNQIVPEEGCLLSDGDLIHLGFVTLEFACTETVQSTVPLPEALLPEGLRTQELPVAKIALLFPNAAPPVEQTLPEQDSEHNVVEQTLLELLTQDCEASGIQDSMGSLVDMLAHAEAAPLDDVLTQLAQENTELEGCFPRSMSTVESAEDSLNDPLNFFVTNLSLNEILDGTLTIDEILENLGNGSDTLPLLEPVSVPPDPLALLTGQSVVPTLLLTDSMLRDHHRPGLRTPYQSDAQPVRSTYEKVQSRSASDQKTPLPEEH